MAYIPSSGSVVAFQSNPSVLQATVGLNSTNASVITVGSPVANQSVSGTVQTDVRGSVATVIIGGSILTTTGNSSVQVLNFPANQSVSGTVTANQGTTPWIIGSVYGNMSGSVVAFQGTTEWTVKSSISGGIFPISGSVAATVTNTNLNVGGSVVAFQSGTRTTSLVSTVPSSVIVGASAFGTFPVTQATTEWTVKSSVSGGLFPISGSVAATITNTNVNISGSVAAFNISTNASFIGVSKDSSIIAILSAPSIVGTYAEDAAHTSADKGIFTLAVRNDAVASFVGANLEYAPTAVDSAGRTLIKPFAAGESSLIAHTSLVSAGTTASVQLFAAAGAGLKNYVTDFFVSNTGATTTLVIFGDGDGSVLGRTIAPTGGGSNAPGLSTPLVNVRANTPFNVQLGSSSSVVYLTVLGYKAP